MEQYIINLIFFILISVVIYFNFILLLLKSSKQWATSNMYDTNKRNV